MGISGAEEKGNAKSLTRIENFRVQVWKRERKGKAKKQTPKHQALAYYAKLWFWLSINKQLLFFLRKYLKIFFISIQLI